MACPHEALAEGKRDLEDGIAFYENLDSERAQARLSAAAESPDLAPADRARARMYLGLVLFELGQEEPAKTSFRKALELDGKIAPPAGTSPKIVEAFEAVRQSAKSRPAPALAPLPLAPSKLPPSDPPPAPPPEPASGSHAWLLWGGLGVVAATAAVLTVVLLVAPGQCPSGQGGCATVTLALPGAR